MPSYPRLNLKSLKLSLLFLFAPLFFYGQTLTGLWTGALSNDSTTVRKDQSFEIALTEYGGKVYGYSRSEFIVNDTLYYVVKRVKGTITGDICEVHDDEIIAYNFRGKLDKGIKVTSTFRRNQSDSAWHLDGTWKTNATKKYYSVTGNVILEEEKDLGASKIFPHLEELKIADEIAFYKERKEGAPIVKLVKPERNNPLLSKTNTQTPANSGVVNAAKPVFTRAETIQEPGLEITDLKQPGQDREKTETTAIALKDVGVKPSASSPVYATQTLPEPAIEKIDKPTETITRTETKSIAGTIGTVQPGVPPVNTTTGKVTVPEKNAVTSNRVSNEQPVTNNQALAKNESTQTQPSVSSQTNAATRNNNPAGNTKDIASNTVVKQQPSKPIAATTSPAPVNNASSTAKTAVNNPVSTTASTTVTKTEPVAVQEIKRPEKPMAEITAKSAVVEGRKSEFTQVVNFKSDSLELALYDNGEIDGDTVSIYMDGQVILARQGLKASAIRKTIQVTPGHEDFTLVLFAENLGKYPPNTGLLVVRDGDEIYNLRFSSDFQKNTGIVFRRKQ